MTTAKTIEPATKGREGRSTREVILDVAARLIHVHGYNHTTLDDILRESGVSKGNFYYHFKSKEDLGYAILDELVASFLGRTLDPCFSDPSARPLAQIRCFLDGVLETQRASNCVGGCPLGNLVAELSDVHEGFRTRLARVFEAWQARLTDALEAARRCGDVGEACRPEAVAPFLVASLEGAILLTKLTKDIAVMERCVVELGRYLSLYELRG